MCCCRLLTGDSIPEDILAHAQDVLDSPLGPMLTPMLMQMEGQLGSATATGFGQTASSGDAVDGQSPHAGQGSIPQPTTADGGAAAGNTSDTQTADEESNGASFG